MKTLNNFQHCREFGHLNYFSEGKTQIQLVLRFFLRQNTTPERQDQRGLPVVFDEAAWSSEVFSDRRWLYQNVLLRNPIFLLQNAVKCCSRVNEGSHKRSSYGEEGK